MRARNTVLISVAILLILVGVGVARRNNKAADTLEIGLSEEDLNDLETQLSELEFDDLEGISFNNSSKIRSLKSSHFPTFSSDKSSN